MHSLTLVAAAAALGISKVGAACFGALIGWTAYFINRWRKDVVIGDLAAVIGAVGGAAVLKLFPAQTELFGYYGLGLAIGFFGYFVILVVFVLSPKKYNFEYFLAPPEGQHPMLANPGRLPMSAKPGDLER